MNKKAFRSPGSEYRGVSLWMLNDKLETEEILRQLKGISDAGWGAVICRTFNGLRTEYLSDEWNRIIREVIEQAGRLGMKVWLQAGYMPSAIPQLAQDEQHRVLIRKRKAEAVGASEVLLLQDREHSYYARRMEHVLDLLAPKACASYLDKAYTGSLCGPFGDAFGKTVETVWVDEPHFKPPLMPWTEDLPDVFRKKWGYSLTESLPLLFAPERDYHRVRHHYWRTVLDLLLTAYFGQVSEWCREHGVRFSGHLMGEDTLRSQISWTGACMPCYEYMQLPGIDHLTLSLTWPAERSFILPPKQCSSAANQLGKKEKLAETYAVSSQGITFEDRKWIAEWMMMLGINTRCYHGSFYSMRGRRKRIYVPHLSYQQPWWPHNRLIADYFARLSYVMRQGSYEADVLVIHPVESAYCLYDPTAITNVHNRVGEPEDIRRLNDALVVLSENLLRIHRGFEYGDEGILARHGSVRGRSLAVGKMSYRAAVLPHLLTLRETTLKLLERFIEGGGTLLVMGDPPTRLDGVVDRRPAGLCAKARRVDNTPVSLEAALDERVPTDVQITAAGGDDPGVIWLHARRIGDKRVFVLANPTRDQTVHATLHIRAPGSLERWELASGRVEPAAQKRDGEVLAAALTLPPTASHVLVLQPTRFAPVGEWAATRTFPVSGEYGISRDSPNALTLDFCRFRRGRDDWSELLPVSGVQEILAAEGYNGTVSLRFFFEAEDRPGRAMLVVEDAAEYVISVNGRSVEYAGLPCYVDRSFHPVDITEHVGKGPNTVELNRAFEAPSEAAFMLASLFHTATGVELEAVYLIGDFAVRGSLSNGEVRPRCVRYDRHFRIVHEKQTTAGDLTADGYPFFAGNLSLEASLELPKPAGDERAFLVLPSMDAVVVETVVNAKPCGSIAWPPYEVEITAAVRPGKNALQLELVSSLRNLLGPHHRPSGEPTQTWKDGWTGLSSAERRDTDLRSGPDWYTRRDSEDVFWSDDFFFLPFGIREPPIVEYRRRS